MICWKIFEDFKIDNECVNYNCIFLVYYRYNVGFVSCDLFEGRYGYVEMM